MDPVHTPQTPQAPPPLTPKNVKAPVVQELPHLVVGEEKRSKIGLFAIIVLSILLLGLPVGIYLVSQRTQLVPQAAVVPVEMPERAAGIFMESKLTSASSQMIPVDVYIKSSIDDINLVNAKIKFDPGLLALERIATNSAEVNQKPSFNKWVEVSFDNAQGSAEIIAGVPAPGLKTSGDEKLYLATIYLKPKRDGTAILQIDSGSEIFRNSDNVNIYRTGNDLALNLNKPVSDSTSSAIPKASIKKNEEPLIVVISPRGGANYSYFKEVGILWSSFNVDRISQVNLLVNGEKLGAIGQNIGAQEGKFSWAPKSSLGVPYVQPANSYEIEVIGVSEDGEVARATSGLFGIVGTEEVKGFVPSGVNFEQNQLQVSDISRALTNFVTEPLLEASLDLNKDGIINDLDIYLIQLNLRLRGIIK